MAYFEWDRDTLHSLSSHSLPSSSGGNVYQALNTSKEKSLDCPFPRCLRSFKEKSSLIRHLCNAEMSFMIPTRPHGAMRPCPASSKASGILARLDTICKDYRIRRKKPINSRNRERIIAVPLPPYHRPFPTPMTHLCEKKSTYFTSNDVTKLLV